MLAAFGADLAAQDENGDTARSDANEQHFEGIVSWLDCAILARWTPLEIAVAGRHHAIIVWLLQHGCRNPDSFKPGKLLHVATQSPAWCPDGPPLCQQTL